MIQMLHLHLSKKKKRWKVLHYFESAVKKQKQNPMHSVNLTYSVSLCMAMDFSVQFSGFYREKTPPTTPGKFGLSLSP